MPFDAEPKNGDFAAYVDQLVNQGGHAPGAGMSTEMWAAKASAHAIAQTKPAGFPTGHGTATGPGSHKPGAGATAGTHKIPGSHKLAGDTNPNAWGRSGESTVPMTSLPASQGPTHSAPGAIHIPARLQQASDTLAFIIKQFNSRRS